nr:isopentenyl-diphosphate Delta-isomerase [Candidatus Rhodobacter lobularis]
MNAMIPAWVDGALAPVEKLAVHHRGLRHKAVSVFVMSGDHLLLQRRALGKYHTPGLWANTCCTHPHWQEDAVTCATRRLDEELGLRGLTLEHRDQLEYRADVGGGMVEHELVDIFVAEMDRAHPMRANPSEVMDTSWMTLDEIHAQIGARAETFTPWFKIYMAQHASQIFGATLGRGVA